MQAANASSSSDNVVLVPSNSSFCYFYVEAYNIFNVTIQVYNTFPFPSSLLPPLFHLFVPSPPLSLRRLFSSLFVSPHRTI